MVRVLRALCVAVLCTIVSVHALPEESPDECVKVVRVRRIVHADPDAEDSPPVTTELIVTTKIATSLAVLTRTTVATSLALLTRTTVESTTATYGLEIPPVTIVSAVTVHPDARVVPLHVPRFVPYKCPSKPCVVEKRVPVPVPVIVQPSARACPTVTMTSVQTVYETGSARFVECGDSTEDEEATASVVKRIEGSTAVAAPTPTYDPVFASVSAEFTAVLSLMSAPTVCLARR